MNITYPKDFSEQGWFSRHCEWVVYKAGSGCFILLGAIQP